MMTKLFLITLLTFSCLPSSLRGCDEAYIPFDVEAFTRGVQLPSDSSFEETVAQIQKLSNSRLTQVWIVAGWIYEHMHFDMDKFIRGGPVDNFERIYKTKEGICGEYASLFSAFCNALGIRNHVIEGYVPELGKSTEFVETNHAWNTVEIAGCWYHCDLQGLSGKLYTSGEGRLSFKKEVDPFNFLARDDYFLSRHIPADPMWQLKKHPQEMDFLRSGTHLIQTGSPEFNYPDSIQLFENLSDSEQRIKFAENAHAYNPANHNVMVVTYYNEAVDLIHQAEGNRKKLDLANRYVLKAREHVDFASNGVQELKPDINKVLNYLNTQLH